MDTWENLERKCKECKKCGLAETRTNVVFGTGSRDSNVLFIGEGPGHDEDIKGEPFVGRAGKLLDEMLAIIRLSRENNIYIANIVKCRPPGNRDPQDAERDACIDWLRMQIEMLYPKIIVCLGRIAAGTILSRFSSFDHGEFKITRDHGKWYDLDMPQGAKMMALYHPAALLRDPYKRPDTFIDLKKLEREIYT